MHLHDGEGSLELSVEGYEVPDAATLPGAVDRESAGGDAEDWDANWLVVSGRVHAAGVRWSFRDPCLTTWEAHQLASFLAEHPVDRKRSLGFTEPHLAFSLSAVGQDGVVLTATFAAETAPPASAPAPAAPDGLSLVLRLRRTALTDAADAWRAELTAFPRR